MNWKLIELLKFTEITLYFVECANRCPCISKLMCNLLQWLQKVEHVIR